VSRGFFEAIEDAFDFSRFLYIVDVGGGQGQPGRLTAAGNRAEIAVSI
jgi:hypothetical protein